MNLLLNQENVLFNSIYSEFKRNLSAKNTPLGYSLTSWMWQPCQGKSTWEFAENTLPEFAKKTRQSPSFGRKKKHTGTEKETSSVQHADWGGAGFPPRFAAHISHGNGIFGMELDSDFHPEGTVGCFFIYIYIFKSSHVLLFSLFFHRWRWRVS